MKVRACELEFLKTFFSMPEDRQKLVLDQIAIVTEEKPEYDAGEVLITAIINAVEIVKKRNEAATDPR